MPQDYQSLPKASEFGYKGGAGYPTGTPDAAAAAAAAAACMKGGNLGGNMNGPTFGQAIRAAADAEDKICSIENPGANPPPVPGAPIGCDMADPGELDTVCGGCCC